MKNTLVVCAFSLYFSSFHLDRLRNVQSQVIILVMEMLLEGAF